LTLQQLFEQHKKNKCSNCNKNSDYDCEIHITIDGTTKCEEGEIK